MSFFVSELEIIETKAQSLRHTEDANQSDKIRCMFAHWAIVYYGQFFENC
jgi:hypothetical protein